MANKRMFSIDIVDSDRFYDLPFNSQLLYFHLGMKADVKGFIEPKKVVRSVGLKIEDLRPLVENNYVIPFDTGVVVITHWKVNNLTREDREAPTRFIAELAQLSSSNNEYNLLLDNSGSTPAQYRIGKDRLGKDSIGEREAHTHIEKQFSSKDEITDSVLYDISQTYEIPLEFVESCWDSASNWLMANGKSKKNYKAFLCNWVKREKAQHILQFQKLKGGTKHAIDASNI